MTEIDPSHPTWLGTKDIAAQSTQDSGTSACRGASCPDSCMGVGDLRTKAELKKLRAPTKAHTRIKLNP